MLEVYKVVRDEDNILSFTTDFGLKYFARFRLAPHFSDYPPLDQYLFEYSFEIFDLETGHPDKHDPKVKNTVAQIVFDFLAAEPQAVVLFICDSLDGLHRHRKITFNKWFKEYERINPGAYVKLDAELADGQTQMFAAIFFKRAHTHSTQIHRAFQEMWDYYLAFKNLPLGK